MKIRTNIFTAFLGLLNVDFTISYANKLYNEFSFENNFYEFSKLLSIYNIDNKTIKLPFTEKVNSLFTITPFITFYNNEFIIICSIRNDVITYIENGKQKYVDALKFDNDWSRIVLIAETSDKSIEPDFEINRAKNTIYQQYKLSTIFFLIWFAVLFFLLNTLYKSLNIILLLTINLIGSYISHLLVLKQLHIQNFNADNICSSLKNGNCNAVLDSPVAKAFGVFGWSEIGFCYFISNIVILLIFPDLLYYLAWINICALPYSIWSIWYQKMKVKQWCPLCLIVQAILWIIFAIYFISDLIYIPTINFFDIILIGAIFFLIFLITHLYSSSLSKEQSNLYLTTRLNRLKNEKNVFSVVLQNQLYFTIDKYVSQILFGNRNAKTIITILSNPYCKGCSLMHGGLNQLLEKFNNMICIQYIFTSLKPALHSANRSLIEIYLKHTPDDTWNIYTDWFEKGRNNATDFFTRNQISGENESVEEEFKKHQSWAKENKLTLTPIILINGYKLPDYYTIDDIKTYIHTFIHSEE